MRVPKGKYQSVIAINLDRYVHTAPADLPESDLRLEFWAWDFIADRDTVLDIRYNRMEAYGMRVFNIPGAMPGYQIFVQPISLTRLLQVKKTNPDFFVRGEKLRDLEQKPLTAQAKGTLLAPPADRLNVTAYIDGEEVAVLMKQQIKEYYGADSWGDAYLLTVDAPKHPKEDLPYQVFKIELTDLESGDRGEGLYYLEKENYVR